MLLICTACTTAYSVGAPRCPHCGGRKAVEEGSPQHLRLVIDAQDQAAEEREAKPDA